jgi:hypothetical protein
MQRLGALIGMCILFALTWAAGHDILSGERDVWMEYTVVVVSLALASIRLNVELKRLVKRIRNQ